MAAELPFWRARPPAQLNTHEWESLCDGCARCCLVQLEDEDTGEIHLTRIACRFLNLDTSRCTVYPDRQQRQPDCVPLTPERLTQLSWMPDTCAYRLLAEQRPLPDWHPLLLGNDTQVPKAGRHAISESAISDTEAMQAFIIDAYET